MITEGRVEYRRMCHPTCTCDILVALVMALDVAVTDKVTISYVSKVTMMIRR